MGTTDLSVDGMTCGGCSSRLTDNFMKEIGVISAEVNHISGTATIEHTDEIFTSKLEEIVLSSGFRIGTHSGINWNDKKIWKQSANNTKWCLIGCSIGEFGTLAAYSLWNIGDSVAIGTTLYYFLLILPLINGLITSVMLETGLLVRSQMDLKNALSTALGMSFISMLMMEIAMEITDLIFTMGELGMNPIAIPFMLMIGFLAPWPYNYWRLKKYGKSCH